MEIIDNLHVNGTPCAASAWGGVEGVGGPLFVCLVSTSLSK